MQEFFNQYRVPLGFALLVAVMLWGQRGQLAEMFGKLWARVPGLPVGNATGAVSGLTENQQDFAALERLQARFERQKCKEGTAAVDVCLTHFFHKEG